MTTSNKNLKKKERERLLDIREQQKFLRASGGIERQDLRENKARERKSRYEKTSAPML